MRRLPAALAVAASIGLLGTVLLPPSAAASSVSTIPAAAPADDTTGPLTAFYAQQLTWTPCDGLACTWLTVPLDYADPSGATIRIRVVRSAATGAPATRQGSLVVNPGGPGASGLDFAAYVAEAIAPTVATQFDVVGFDTRGVGRSAPITCVTGAQTTRWLRTDGTPRTAAQERRLMALGRQIGQGCLSMSPTLARHVGSDDTVRDLDILRAALGDTRLNWLGFSYGTYLGALYADLFPDRVGRFVLDGALDPSLDAMQISRGQSSGFQLAVSRFARDCAKRATCAWHTRGAVLRGINRILARLDVSSMPTGGKTRLVQNEALSAIFYTMYTPLLWPSLRTALRQANTGNGSALQLIADFAAERTGPDTYATNMASAFYAINCWDMPAPPQADGLRAAATVWSRDVGVPELARAMAWGNAPCSNWFGHSDRAPAAASSTTTAPILVVGTTYDPATPYPWAVALSKQLTTSTLLTYRGDGHTAFGAGSRCIDHAVTSYLLGGTLPAPGTVCR